MSKYYSLAITTKTGHAFLKEISRNKEIGGAPETVSFTTDKKLALRFQMMDEFLDLADEVDAFLNRNAAFLVEAPRKSRGVVYVG